MDFLQGPSLMVETNIIPSMPNTPQSNNEPAMVLTLGICLKPLHMTSVMKEIKLLKTQPSPKPLRENTISEAMKKILLLKITTRTNRSYGL